MLFTGKQQKLHCNISSALGQLRSLVRRLAKNESLKLKYIDSIKKDLAKRYISLLEKGELERQDFWYLPHHPIVNPRKPEKVSRVCNAAKRFRGYCLNDVLMKGPDLLQNLIGILLRFRENCVALTADTEEMFLQIQVPEQQRRYLRFLWTDEDGKLMPYQYSRHIFGAKSSPTCANYALQQCAKQFGLEHPIASHMVMDNFYVDDMLLSVHTIEQASEVIHDLKSLLAKGGFNLTKWFSNFDEIFENSEIPPIESEDNPKVLGLEWIAADDLLSVRKDQEFLQKTNWMQRQVFSTVSQVFDPLGFMAPFVIRGRMLMKRIWQTQGQKWDSPIAEDINTEFKKWVQEWSNSKQLTVSRWYNQESCDRVELHVFGDASEDAFCAVSYVVIIKPNGDRLLRLNVGKTRVAPMKHHTIPKLELMAAVTANRIKDLILKEHRISFASIYLWSDSTTVLQWLRSSDKKQPTLLLTGVQKS